MPRRARVVPNEDGYHVPTNLMRLVIEASEEGAFFIRNNEGD